MPQILSSKVLPKNTKDQVISISQEACYEKGRKRGQSAHFSVGENCEKPAAELPLPTPCDSTHNQDFLTEDALTAMVLKQKAQNFCVKEKSYLYWNFAGRACPLLKILFLIPSQLGSNNKNTAVGKKTFPSSALPTNYHWENTESGGFGEGS